ncbi:protein BEAN1 [Rhinophrynus dorsalis]
MSIKLTCTKIHSNQSSAFPEYPACIRNDGSLMVSPLVVAGIVIGLVLFLSCVTIIIGSLRKDGGVRDCHLDPDPSNGGISCTASNGDLRSAYTSDIFPAFESGFYLEPPCYDDCVDPGSTGLYLPTDEPPPYSVEDPHLRHELEINICTEETALTSQENGDHLLPTTLLSSVELQVAPPYKTRSKMSLPIPIISMDIWKDKPTPVPEADV